MQSDGPSREMKHARIIVAIRRQREIINKLDELKARIIESSSDEKLKCPIPIEQVPSLIEVLNNIPDMLEKLRCEATDKIDEIEGLIF